MLNKLNWQSKFSANLIGVLISIMIIPFTIAQPFQETKIKASDSVKNLFFGKSLSVDGNRMIVGAPEESGAGQASGAVYVFDRETDGSWTETAKLTASNRGAFHNFGTSIDVQGDIILIGAPQFGKDVNTYTGAAYIFEKQTDGTWQEVAHLVPDDIGDRDNLGYAVGLSGNDAFIGAYGHDHPSLNAGAVYHYRRQSSGAWLLEAKLSPNEEAQYAEFGASISMDGTRAIIGAPNYHKSPYIDGAVYVFEKQENGSWIEESLLNGVNPTYDATFGESVSLDGDKLIVGAPNNSLFASNAGSATIFEYQSDSTWVAVAEIGNIAPDSYDDFGNSVSISGNQAVVGSPHDDLVNGIDSNEGSAHLYERDENGDWNLRERIIASDGFGGNIFGFQVFQENGITFVSAISESTREIPSGAVYIYEEFSGPQVTSFTLIDAETNFPIPVWDPIPDGATINLSNLPTTFLSIRANTAGPVESVYLTIGHRFQTENIEPYSLFGDHEGNYRPRKFKPGTRTITATPYSEDGLRGEAGVTESITVHFTRNQTRNASLQSYPNPFNPQTTFTFELTEPSDVRLSIFDLTGREVDVLVDSYTQAGVHTATFNAKNLASGVYFARIKTNNNISTHKIVLMR